MITRERCLRVSPLPDRIRLTWWQQQHGGDDVTVLTTCREVGRADEVGDKSDVGYA